VVRRVPELGEICLREASTHEEMHGLGPGDATIAVGVGVREPVVVLVRLLHDGLFAASRAAHVARDAS
jgi:hypothetical protein